jgi:hypothetical protein
MLASIWPVVSAIFSGVGVTSAILRSMRLINCKALISPSWDEGTVRSA